MNFSTNIINSVAKVFDDEIEALEKIKNNILLNSILRAEFEKAVRLFKECKGKIILTGIGKSGIIAKKISATLSSTGTKAIYIHPVEGMHGDLGIVNKNDCLLIISKSGKNDEIISILPFFKNYNIPIVSITANKESKLAQQSDIVLHMEIDKEACPLNLAPTTSTTASLVIGDALAITLMKEKKFKKEHFALYHPAGHLGKSLLIKVKDIMHKGDKNPVVSYNDDMKVIITEVTSKYLGSCSVIDDNGKFIGLITDYDIRTHLLSDFSKLKAKDIMNPNPIFIYENSMAVDALAIMEDRKRPFNILPVINETNEPVGMIQLHDLVKTGL